ncbi:Protein patched homolog 1 [Seminavis robusta]|uniref:Protein patched homolog 1 n=1 Tax=Seminavis robusta TaxID=568900 RepID=A0A9N8DGE7_9STRA|nr:Protein patched homolog 1 [Seminavis robusta]|eukprot:Sro145_g067300.1 Protein patched homolog 1 (997) ;mRNA; f:49391-52604
MLTPLGSRPQLHAEWIAAPTEPFGVHPVRLLQIVLHNHGANVLLDIKQTRRVLQTVDRIRTTHGYEELCQQGIYRNFDNQITCRIFSVSGFWNDHSLDHFDDTVSTTQELHQIISGPTFADGSPVLHDSIVGNYQRNNNNTLITFAQSFLVRLEIPDTDDTNAFESKLLGGLDELRREWMMDDTDPVLTMDFMTVFAYQLEALVNVIGDLYLVAFSALLMVGFTCLLFYKRNPSESRMLLGVASVTTICCSLMAGNGLMFLMGVPYSLIHQMLPFVIFGIGLDDTFIITGAYFRTDPQAHVQDRIRTTMQEVGWSISVTTLTTVFAFSLGYFTSSFPGVHWLCLSAMATISIDFYFQITFFVALLVLDEQRVQAKHKDCCFWIPLVVEDTTPQEQQDDDMLVLHAKNIVDVDELLELEEEEEEELEEEEEEQIKKVSTKDNVTSSSTTEKTLAADEMERNDVVHKGESMGHESGENNHEDSPVDTRPIPERIMSRYADILLCPKTKVLVLAVFATFFAYCCWSVTCLTQEFDVGDYVRDDSYLKNVFTSLHEYSSVVRPMALYFRHVDQSSPAMQQQMIDYVEAMEALPQVLALEEDDNNLTSSTLEAGFTGGVDKIRPFCWVRDFQQLEQLLVDQPPIVLATFQNMTFNEKLDFALSDKILREVYGQDIIRDDEGNILASRCFLFLQDLDLKDVEAQIDMLFDQRSVSESQPVNQQIHHQHDWAFFAHDELFGYWEAYAVSVQELWFTIVAGVIAVTFIAFVFVPHWTGAFLICPLIVILYINMLGSLQNLGLHINGFTYVCVVVSIGLLVDFLIHVLLRYFECPPGLTRDERVKQTLETMGASILIGGTTTFLAVIPLAISSLKIFQTVFNAFFAMVALGVTHGLILLPVVLSLIGPTTNVDHNMSTGGGDNAEDPSSKDDKDLQGSPASALTWATSASFVDPVDVDNMNLHVETLKVIAEASEHSEESLEDMGSERSAESDIFPSSTISEASA